MTSALPQGLSVRPVRPDELGALLALYTTLHVKDAALPADEVLQSVWQEMLENPSHHILVAEVDGLLVASATLLIVSNLTRGARPYALVENVVTLPAWRKRGIAGTLLRTAQNMAWAANCYKLTLTTGRRDAETLRFYRNAGFSADDKTAFVARPE